MRFALLGTLTLALSTGALAAKATPFATPREAHFAGTITQVKDEGASCHLGISFTTANFTASANNPVDIDEAQQYGVIVKKQGSRSGVNCGFKAGANVSGVIVQPTPTEIYLE
jgi:hypothetical protein